MASETHSVIFKHRAKDSRRAKKISENFFRKNRNFAEIFFKGH